MKGDVNAFSVTGNLVGDPALEEVTVDREPKAIMTFRMLQNLSERDNDVLAVNVTAWGARARYVHSQWMSGNLVKGTRVRVDGRIKLDVYTNSQGEARGSVDLTLEHLDFAPIPRTNSEERTRSSSNRRRSSRATVGAGTRSAPRDDSDIPF